ncbi:hypothetical protein PGRAN_07858 [Listeria grandensis FSL F6-0971]|uniref:Uncharacterized protein n=1 Tax=Listeria grandensis FSL F6-0971 TaxID=1265819 RepID=W7BT78_9LIST|nr:hypothetical protein [Listeria grandensis]EUJ23558.1 hypothetical protein PGRAN_07858 [Listeria grandensis FSL F6-0971]
MGEHEIRYFVIPMIVVFILGIATISGPTFPVFEFMIVGLIAVLIGTICGWLAVGIKLLVKLLQTWKEHRAVKKVIVISKR